MRVRRYEIRDLREDYSYRFRLFSDTHEGLSHPIEYELPAYVVAKPTGAFVDCMLVTQV